MEFDNIETIKRAIEIDAGASLLPEPTVLGEVHSGSLVAVPLDTDELVRPLGIIHRRGKEMSTVAMRFIDLLQRQARSSVDQTATVTIEHGNGHAINGHAANGHAAGHAVAGPTENGHATTNHQNAAASIETGDRPKLVRHNRRR
jgi:hypothetical protein